jgi:Sulfotransferase family
MIDTVYILSAGHSGSTLLNLILGSHSKATAVSELTHLPMNFVHNELCTCGQGVRECEFWRRVAQKIDSVLGIDVVGDPLRLDLGFMDSPHEVYRRELGMRYRAMWRIRRAAVYSSLLSGIPIPRFTRSAFDSGLRNRLAVYNAIRELAGTPMVVDASKEYLQGIELHQLAPARTRLILIVRDGRAVFYSNLKRGFSRSYSINAWRKYYRHALPILQRRVDPAHVLRIRYEDLATNTEREIRNACNFVALDFERSMLDTSTKQIHITSGNNMRFNSTAGIALDMKWRTALSGPDRVAFEREAGSLNRQLGYE